MLSRRVVNFCSPKSGLRTEMTNGILYLSSRMNSSLFVAFMIKFRQDFTEYKSSEKPMKTLHFSPLVMFLLHYEFIFTPMRVPWNFHGICAFELFVLKRIFSYNTPYTLKWRCHNLRRSRKLLWYQSSSVVTTLTWFAKVSRTNIQMYDALHVRIREGHRTSGYSVRETLAKQVYVVATEGLWYHKSCGVNCGIAISKCTGYYTRKCVSAQTTRKHKFHGNSMELSCE